MKRNHLIVILAFMLIFVSLHICNAGWYSPHWKARSPIYIDNTQNSNTLWNFQVKFTISYRPGMQDDFDDLRFTTDNGIKPIPYWIEEYNSFDSASVYVNIPNIPAYATTCIYAYYDNPNAQGQSDGYAVFEFFDDFNDGDINDWTIINGSWKADNQFLEQMITANHRKILSSYSIPAAIIVEANMIYLSSYQYSGNHIFFSDGNGNNGYKFGFAGLNTNGSRIARIHNGNVIFLVTDPTICVDYFAYIPLKAKITYDGNGFFTFLFKAANGVQVYLEAYDNVHHPPFLLANYVGSHTSVDDLRARKYTNPEPVCTQGLEEKKRKREYGASEPSLLVNSYPFSQTAQICLRLPNDSKVSGQIYDCSGRSILSCFDNQSFSRGERTIVLGNQINTLPSGTLFIKLRIDEEQGKIYYLTEKLLLVR